MEIIKDTNKVEEGFGVTFGGNEECELKPKDDYKERFKAEYHQTKDRYEKLKKFNTRIEAAEMTDNAVEMPKHDCPLHLLCQQQRLMGEYLHILEIRAVIEHIDL